MTKDETESAARVLRRELVSDELLDRMMAVTSERGVELTGEDGALRELIKAVLERGIRTKLTDHLGYQKHDPAGRGSGNSRNGTTPKTVDTQAGPVTLDRPQDRQATFTSRLVPAGQRLLGGLDDMIISLTSRDASYDRHGNLVLWIALTHAKLTQIVAASELDNPQRDSRIVPA